MKRCLCGTFWRISCDLYQMSSRFHLHHSDRILSQRVNEFWKHTHYNHWHTKRQGANSSMSTNYIFQLAQYSDNGGVQLFKKHKSVHSQGDVRVCSTCGMASVKYNWVNPEMITAMRLESDYAAVMEPIPFNPYIKYDLGEALSKFASFSAASITHIYYVHFHYYALYFLENLHTQNLIFIVQMSFLSILRLNDRAAFTLACGMHLAAVLTYLNLGFHNGSGY